MKKKVLLAILLGPLTYFVAPFVILAITVPFFLLGKILSQDLLLLTIIAKIFHLEGALGYFGGLFIFLGLFMLLSDLTVAIISWFIFRSKKLALVSFISALLFQILILGIGIPMMNRAEQESTEAYTKLRDEYQTYAKINGATFKMDEEFSKEWDIMIPNKLPEEDGPRYKILQITVPISVSQAGTYKTSIKYRFSRGDETRETQIKSVTKIFTPGEHLVAIDFIPDDFTTHSYEFWSPEFVGGIVTVNLSYMISEKEASERSPKPNSILERRIHEQYLKDFGLDEREPSTDLTLNKFVEKKEIQL